MDASAFHDDHPRRRQPEVRVLRAQIRGGRVQGALDHQDAWQSRALDQQRRCGPRDRPERARGIEPRVVPGFEGRAPVDPPGVGVPLRPAARPVDVAALHGVVHSEPVLVLGACLVVLADQLAGGAAVQVGGQGRGLPRPERVGVPALQERVVELVRADHRAVRAGHRMRLQVRAGLVPRLVDLRAGAAEPVDAVVGRHPGEERQHPALERVVLGDVVGVPDPARIHRAVQDHPLEPVREEGGVDLAEIGPVGVAEIGDFRHAQGRADGVHVPRGVRGGHVGQQPAVCLPAVGGVGLRAADEHLLRRRIRRDVIRAHAGEEGRVAMQRGNARADAAGVEADDVVVGGHRRVKALGDGGGEPEPAAARPARVDQHVPLLLAGGRGGRDLGQRQRDLPAVRVGVVEWHRQAGALHVEGLHGAGMPAQRRSLPGGGGNRGRPLRAGTARATAAGGGAAGHGEGSGAGDAQGGQRGGAP